MTIWSIAAVLVKIVRICHTTFWLFCIGIVTNSDQKKLQIDSHHMIGVCLPSQSASGKHNQEQKAHKTFAHLMNFSKQMSAMIDNHTLVILAIE